MEIGEFMRVLLVGVMVIFFLVFFWVVISIRRFRVGKVRKKRFVFE